MRRGEDRHIRKKITWKDTHYGPIQKSQFPSLLRRTIEAGGLRFTENIQAGFRGAGIHPFAPEHVYEKLPKNCRLPTLAEPLEPLSRSTPHTSFAEASSSNISDNTNSSNTSAQSIDTSVSLFLVNKFTALGETAGTRRKQRITKPGRAVTLDAFGDGDNISDPDDPPPLEPALVSTTVTSTPVRRGRKRKKKTDDGSSSSSTVQASCSSAQASCSSAQASCSSAQADTPTDTSPRPVLYEQGNFVLVEFLVEGDTERKKYYIGRIENQYNFDIFQVKFLRNQRSHFAFPAIDDIADIPRARFIKPVVLKTLRRDRFLYEPTNVEFIID